MRILTEPAELREFCERASKASSLAIDTEFERERTYKPILQLLQAATPTEAVIIDPLAIEDLSPFWELVAEPGIQSILHAAGQDLEIYYDQARVPPRSLFDTQVAGALLGMGEQPGYADLLRRVLNVRLQKHERVTDWGRRPLTDAQLKYALDDVLYLHDLRDELERRLNQKGRREWLDQELKRYESVDNYEVNYDRLWLRVSRHRSLKPRGLAILRELAAWRERTAESRNIPRGRVVQDEMLVEIARRAPGEVDDLRALRRLHPKEIQRSGPELIEAVQRGLEVPDSDLPTMPAIPDEDPDRNLTADLLAVYLKYKARRASIAPSYVGTKKDIVRLVENHANGGDRRCRLLDGWRYELAGRELVELLDGRRTLGVNPSRSTLRITEEASSEIDKGD